MISPIEDTPAFRAGIRPGDLIIKLDAGETVFVTQFFNEDEDNVLYREGQRIHLEWVYGWEVVL